MGFQGWEARNFALRPSPAANFVLSSLSGGLLVELWLPFKAMDHPKCSFSVLFLWLVVCPEAAGQSGSKRHWPEQVWPKQVDWPKQVWPEAV